MTRATTLSAGGAAGAFGLLLAASLAAQPAGPPRVSPAASVSQVVGVTEIAITYSRPGVKGRTIWGELVPYGEVWRTGANEATTFTVTSDVKVEGQELKAGKYALFTLPQKDRWTVIFNSAADQWGAFSHDPSKDVIKVELKPETAPFLERMQFAIPDVTDDSAVVELRWEKLALHFTVRVNVRAAAFRKAKEEIAAGDGRTAYRWASYFYGEEDRTEEALGWAKQAASGGATYATLSLEARLLARSGQKEEAKKVAKQALDLAATDDNPRVKQDAEKLATERKGW